MAQLSVRITDELRERMEYEKDRSEYEPSDSQIVRAALDKHLPELSEGNPNLMTAMA